MSTKLRFAGHETFACRTAWLTKGLQYAEQQEGGLEVFNRPEAVVDLGVGRNMVLSIRHWLQAFRLLDDQGEKLPASKLLSEWNDAPAVDPLLEKRDSLWLLHYELVSSEYATVYTFFFREFFKRKASFSFTESETVRALTSWIKSQEQKPPSEKSLTKDFRVLLDNYCMKGGKQAEESMTNLLVDLQLIIKTDFKSDKEFVYTLNSHAHKTVSTPLFACLLSQAFEGSSESLDAMHYKLGIPMLLNRETFMQRLLTTCAEYPKHFVFKDDAGLREVQKKQDFDWNNLDPNA